MIFLPLIHQTVKKFQGYIFGQEFFLGLHGSESKFSSSAHFFLQVIFLFLVLYGWLYSFWGLIMPHLWRSFSGMRGYLWREVFVGGFCSGLLLVFLDYCCYEYTLNGAEIPLGLVTLCLGPMLMLMAILRRDSNKSLFEL
jgi:hypothetical protein